MINKEPFQKLLQDNTEGVWTVKKGHNSTINLYFNVPEQQIDPDIINYQIKPK